MNISHLAAIAAVMVFHLTPAAAQPPPVEVTADRGAAYGTYLRPYAADSLWNARPVNPVLGEYEIPKSLYFPSVSAGAFSTGVFLATKNDKPMLIYGPATTAAVTAGVSDPDSGQSRVVIVPRWPAEVIPATGADGHADIVDPITKTIHSFWKLKRIDGRWTAALYSWSKLDGKGWPDPAHYYQGARAVGIPASAGLIRKHEINDGDTIYRHALAMSLTFNALGNGVTAPAYVFPATSADGALGRNSGQIPQGALLMLPPEFDTSKIATPQLRKIADTLKVYGAYVVDRNDGTPYVIYVENGADFNLMPGGWKNSVAAELDLIRAGLRQVVAADNWAARGEKMLGRGVAVAPRQNLVSMRGPWLRQSGTAVASYNTANQQLEFTAGGTRATYANANNTGMTRVAWALPAVGAGMKFTAATSGGATVRMVVTYQGVVTFDSGHLTNGQSARFKWPGPSSVTLVASGGPAGGAVKTQLVTE